jgi:hypothetical protein
VAGVRDSDPQGVREFFAFLFVVSLVSAFLLVRFLCLRQVISWCPEALDEVLGRHMDFQGGNKSIGDELDILNFVPPFLVVLSVYINECNKVVDWGEGSADGVKAKR